MARRKNAGRSKFRNAGSGCPAIRPGRRNYSAPFSFKPITENWHEPHTAAVMRCSFDGERLEIWNTALNWTIPEPRGFCEPSITRYNGRFYLTLRNDTRTLPSRRRTAFENLFHGALTMELNSALQHPTALGSARRRAFSCLHQTRTQ